MTPTEPTGFGFVEAPPDSAAWWDGWRAGFEVLRMMQVGEIATLTAERDRARDAAVRLEQELAEAERAMRILSEFVATTRPGASGPTQSPTDTPQGAQIGAGGLVEGAGGES